MVGLRAIVVESCIFGATHRSTLVGARDNSILAVLDHVLEWIGKMLVLSASLMAWYTQTINAWVPACNEERQCHLVHVLFESTEFR